MILAQLPRAEIRRRLKDDRLSLRTGPFVASVRTSIARLADAIASLYADFPLIDDCPFADFHIEVAPRSGLRRWLFPQATFAVSGYHNHNPFRLALATPFFEWGFNYCIFRSANHYLVLHGAVVERGGFALVLLGRSGSGKSTLCAALTLDGWRLLSDEITLITAGGFDVVPLARPISLKNHSIEVIRGLAPDTPFGPSVLTIRKGLVAHMRPPKESVERMNEPARLSRFVLVQYEPGATTRWEPLPRATALTAVARQSFNYGIRGRHGFDHLTRLIDECPSGILTYSDVRDAVRMLSDGNSHDAC